MKNAAKFIRLVCRLACLFLLLAASLGFFWIACTGAVVAAGSVATFWTGCAVIFAVGAVAIGAVTPSIVTE